jgi:hypothetical protein
MQFALLIFSKDTQDVKLGGRRQTTLDAVKGKTG